MFALAVILSVLFILFIYLKLGKKTANRKEDQDYMDTERRIHLEPEVDLTVVVPAYNEEMRLPKMLDETIQFLKSRKREKEQGNSSWRSLYNPKQPFSYEIIIVDDGSKDGTTKCGQLYGQKLVHSKLRVITLPKNRGKGFAVRVGVLAARGRYILFADADGASRFSDIEKLEDFLYRHMDSNLLVAIGSRAHMEEEAIASRSLFRTVLMKGFHLLVWTCCVRTVKDTQCGFKMFSRPAARLLFENCHNDSWAFDVELLYLAEQTNCTIGEIGINWTEIDGSKIVPVFSWIRMGWDVVCLCALYSLGVYRTPTKEMIPSNK